VFGLDTPSRRRWNGKLKVALVSGAAGVARRCSYEKWMAGIILAGVGLAALASEYPEKFAEVPAAARLYRARQQFS
jgi:hypothetical protein